MEYEDLKKYVNSRWNLDNVKFLYENYMNKTYCEIALILNKTEKAIQTSYAEWD